MFFSKFITVLSTLSAIKAGTVAQTNAISPRSVSPMVNLMPRDLPPCDKYPFPTEVPSQDVINAAIAEDEAYTGKSYDWQPKSCALGGQNCVKTPSIDGQRMKMSTVAPITHVFEIPDQSGQSGTGAVIYLIPNGYPTFQWTAPGGTVNSYMAHGTDYILVRGWRMSVVFWDSRIPTIPAPGKGAPDNKYCSKIPDDDKTIVYDPQANSP